MAKKKFKDLSPIEQTMQGAAMLMEDWLNGDLPPETPANEKLGFVVLAFNFENKGDERMHYVSSAKRYDMIKALKELVGNLERHQDHDIKDQN